MVDIGKKPGSAIPKSITYRNSKYKLDERWTINTKDKATTIADYVRNTNFCNAVAKQVNGKYYIYVKIKSR